MAAECKAITHYAVEATVYACTVAGAGAALATIAAAPLATSVFFSAIAGALVYGITKASDGLGLTPAFVKLVGNPYLFVITQLALTAILAATCTLGIVTLAGYTVTLAEFAVYAGAVCATQLLGTAQLLTL